jgi:hypothetical protein
MVPGLGDESRRLCTACAGIPGDFFCRRCHAEGRRYSRGLCPRCFLTEWLVELMGDGSGDLRPELVPLFDALRTMPRPSSGLAWLRSSQVQQLLRGLARGEIPLMHDSLARLTNWRTAAFLRELLMHCGMLPVVDKHLLLFERWLDQRLSAVAHPDHARLLQQFATWHVLRRMRTRAERDPLGPAPANDARQQVNQAAAFLAWLNARNRSLTACTQTDIDAWHGELFATRRPAQAFLRWAMVTDRTPKLGLPSRSTSKPAPITQHRRLALIRRLLSDDRTPMRERVAGLLLLLYAQPVSRIVRLTVDDVCDVDGQVLLRLGDPPVPVPAPFAELLLALACGRANMVTATNRDAPWLFPGRRAGQPLLPRSLAPALRTHGIPVQNGRTAAIRQLVLQAPAPVVAGMLGYHDATTTRLVMEAGCTWSRYAPGGRGQQR